MGRPGSYQGPAGGTRIATLPIVHSERPIAVYGALAGNLLIAAAKFGVGLLTGSSAMLSESFHSLVDSGNQLLLLVGIRRSRRPPDERHAFGHGKELYFWSLLVAIALFGIGAGLSVYEGITHLQHPHPITDAVWTYVVIGVAFVIELTSWSIGMHEMLRNAGGRGLWQGIVGSKDPTAVTVVFEDSAAMIGLVLAFLGVLLSSLLDTPLYDALASVGIGLVLAGAAVFLAYESQGLLVGETARPDIVASIRSIASKDPDVAEAGHPLTMHLGPRQILLNLDVTFRDGLSSAQVTAAVDRLEGAIREQHPEVDRIFIEAERLRPAGAQG